MTVPIKERSLEIFGDEKRLDAMATGDTLFGGRLHLTVIGCFRAPQPLPHRVADARGKPVLIVENHNTFWSFGEWNVVARRYAAIVYGGGLNFRLTGRDLHYVMAEVGAPSAEYFGDLDPKGVSIPVDFNLTVEAGRPLVQAALPLYTWLLRNGTRRPKVAAKMYNRDTLLTFMPPLASQLEELWSQGEWLPQEALGTEQLQSLAADQLFLVHDTGDR